MENAKNIGALKTVQLLHRALMLGMFIFLVIAFALNYFKLFAPDLKEMEKSIQIIALIASFIGFFIGNTIFKKKLALAREVVNNNVERFAIYRSGCLLQWALLEASALLVIICFMLTGNYSILALAFVMLLLFSILSPNKIKVQVHLQIPEEELDKL